MINVASGAKLVASSVSRLSSPRTAKGKAASGQTRISLSQFSSLKSISVCKLISRMAGFHLSCKAILGCTKVTCTLSIGSVHLIGIKKGQSTKSTKATKQAVRKERVLPRSGMLKPKVAHIAACTKPIPKAPTIGAKPDSGEFKCACPT